MKIVWLYFTDKPCKSFEIWPLLYLVKKKRQKVAFYQENVFINEDIFEELS